MATTDNKNLARPNKPSQEVAVERNLTEIEQLDTLLAQRLGGDLNGYRDLLTDTTVTGAWAQRQTALTKLERQVLPHDPDNAPDGEALTARLEGMIRLVDLDGVSALVRAAVVHGEMVAARPFLMGNAAVGRLLVRHLITRDGLEPTGVAVTDQYAARAPSVYADAVAAYAGGTHDGVVAWVVWQAEAILVGIQEAQAICRNVQAGTTAVE